MKIRNLMDSDYNKVIELNNENMPAVSELSIDSLKALIKFSIRSLAIEESTSKGFAGFCIILPTNVDYGSENYKWISERYSEFEYLDRIVIAKAFQRKGFGKKLYSHWFNVSPQNSFLVEVNIKPMNEGSILFHEKMGFKSIGEQETLGGKKRVQYMLYKK